MLSTANQDANTDQDRAEEDRPDLEAVTKNVANPRLFGKNDDVVETWYWALPSAKLRRGQVKALNLCGRELALWRGEDGVVHGADAHCPHMGAHFAEGRVLGNELQCFFHGWKYNGEGQLTHIPCQKRTLDVCLTTWPVCEKYGLIWVYTGQKPSHGVFEIPELKGASEVDWHHGGAFEKGCHPNIVMVNAIDEQHFDTVHHLPVDLNFAVTEDSAEAISFVNQTRVPKTSALLRFIGRFYAGALTYKMHYVAGTNGNVTLGPDFLHFHIIFALRPTADGHAEGQTLTVTKHRKGAFGWLVNRVLLFLTGIVGDYFAHGDTKVFKTMRWKFTQPIAADRSILRFVKHVEKMTSVRWGSWDNEQLIALAPSNASAITTASTSTATSQDADATVTGKKVMGEKVMGEKVTGEKVIEDATPGDQAWVG